MKVMTKIMGIVLVLLSVLINSNMSTAKINDEIIFKDNNLHKALCQYYDWNKPFSKEKAKYLAEKNDLLVLENANISDLEGLQYFDNLITIYLGKNNIKNFKPLSKLKNLLMLDISNNAIKGKKLQDTLYTMGKIERLNSLDLSNNRLYDISFLNCVGNMTNYLWLDLDNNLIRDISILKSATNLETLDLSDNRITDVTPLKDLKNFKYWLDLKDNCIIDYKPIKPILDKIYEEGGWEGNISRYDYYTNPVDIGINGKTVKFPYLTAYYKYQPYAEAIPLLKAMGGSAEYIKHMGILVCRYKGNVLAMADFSERYMLNGKVKTMEYPMRRMQYDLAYVPIKDICEALGLKYSVTEKVKIYENEDWGFDAPRYVEIATD